MISASKKNIIITIIFILSFFLIQTIFIQGYKNATGEQKNKLLLNFYTRIINRSAAVYTDVEDDENYYSEITQIFLGNVLSIGKNSTSSSTNNKVYTPVTSKPLNTAIKKTDMPNKPLVLIYHTHTTESYTATEATPIVYSSYARSKDSKTNMNAIGDIVCQILEKDYGIKTIHDTKIHDLSYNDSYPDSLESINKYLKDNPSIQYVFDLHRDGLNDTESARNKYKIKIGNLESTKIMIVVGLNHENSNKNAEFAKTFKSTMDKLYPGVMLPITFRQTAKFNQFTCPNALLFEIGSNLSTFEETRISAEYLARTMAEVIYADIKNTN